METVYEDDRKKAEREELEEARLAAEKLAKDAEIPSDIDDTQVKGFLALFKQQDRNKS